MILAVLQARTSSRRLPGKVLADLHGAPMILRQLERLRRARTLERIVVATSVEASDDDLTGLLMRHGVTVSRGPLDDVLGRFDRCLRAQPTASHVVRLTADCPLADPEVVDAVVGLALRTGAAYASNVGVRTFPKGLDVEVVTAAALRAAAEEATAAADREHVTPFVRARPERFAATNLAGAVDRSRLRWTVDTAADLAFVRAVYAALWPGMPAFGTADVMALLARRPDLAALERAAVAAAA